VKLTGGWEKLALAASLIGTIYVVSRTMQSMREEAARDAREKELLRMVQEIHARVVSSGGA
jgi:hypothetical protein